MGPSELQAWRLTPYNGPIRVTGFETNFLQWALRVTGIETSSV